MNEKLENYLNLIDKYLRPLPISERIDIVKEIKGSILEMEKEKITEEEIIERLGNPKDLAAAYLGDLISQESGLNFKKILTICAFYSVVGFSGLIIIPCLIIISPVFIFCGILTPILGVLKIIASIFQFNIPYLEYVGINIGTLTINPILEGIAIIITGIILYFLGRGAWKLLIKYLESVGKTREKLSI